ncbi:hypothetical protein Taro_049703 [Colocasia esculenta]|uniref:Uncharacterized protein n=1 Tax=Colocasia esculenta TaxID=4460 RepID=A0A843XBY2_COLES|nr:hypothetical protein [Colocasia esculenta]
MAPQAVFAGFVGPFKAAFERAIEEWEQICGLHKEIQRWVTTMKQLKPVMEDAEEKQMSNSELRLWLSELKQVVFDAEDLVDGLTADPAAVQPWGAHSCNVPTMTLATRAQIREINDRLDDLAHRTAMLGLHTSTVEGSHLGRPRRPTTTSLLSDFPITVGRYTEKERVIKEILSSSTRVAESSSINRGFSVLPIVGAGGIGKTTLARSVFYDEVVEKRFEPRIWLHVSKDFDPLRLLGDIFENFATSGEKDRRHKPADLEWLQRRVRWEVEGKALLLVLDDVWEAEPSKWEELFKPLHHCRKGSVVLVTSPNRAVGDKMQGWMNPLPLEPLSHNSMWSVLQIHTFLGTSDAERGHLEAIGRCIVGKLKGLPLAALAIAPLLRNQLDVEHWKRVLEHEVWEWKQAILPALQLSYLYLDGYLKQCFAYCSLFPKGHTYDREDIVQLWEAQCFIRVHRDTTMEMSGSWYCRYLLHGHHLRARLCWIMHDFVHTLAEYVSQGDCFRLEEDHKCMEVADTVRHISICLSKCDPEKLNSLCRFDKLRTLLFLPRFDQFNDLTTHVLEEWLSHMKLLRVLGLRHCQFKEMPESIGDLKQLRYLDLSENDLLEHLPESLGNLYGLQTLKLEGCTSLRALPAGTSELTNLRHLQADDTLVSNLDGLGKLTSLEELKVRGRKARELGGMSMLRKLSMWNLEEVESREEVAQIGLQGMKHLAELRLEWRTQRKGDAVPVNCEVEEGVLQALRPNEDSIEVLHILGYRGVKSPDWMEAMTMASFFKLREVVMLCCPSWKALRSSLSQLPYLGSLTIKSMPQWEGWTCPVWVGDHFNSQQDPDPSLAMRFFPSLRNLQIGECPRLRELPLLPLTLWSLRLEKVGLACLPSLRGCGCCGRETEEASSASAELDSLHVASCCNLTSACALLQHHLPALKEAVIEKCPKLVSFPEKGFGHLLKLKKLWIIRCPGLRRPPPAWEELRHLPPKLEDLRIEWCGNAMGWWWRTGLQRVKGDTGYRRRSMHSLTTGTDKAWQKTESHEANKDQRLGKSSTEGYCKMPSTETTVVKDGRQTKAPHHMDIIL